MQIVLIEDVISTEMVINGSYSTNERYCIRKKKSVALRKIMNCRKQNNYFM